MTTRVFVSTENNSVYSNALSELPAVVTGVKDINPELNAALQLYPNPSNGNFTIQVKDVKAQINAVRIYDQQGKLLKDIRSNEPQNISVIGNLPAGIYFLYVHTDEGMGIKKLIVQ